MIFVLMTFKSTYLYEKVFEMILNVAGQRQFAIEKHISDFELPIAKAARKAFPNITTHGCSLHLQQNIVKRLGRIQLKKKYAEDLQFAKEIHMFAALAFLEPREVLLYINAFERQFQKMHNFLESSSRKIIQSCQMETLQCSLQSQVCAESFHHQIHRILSTSNCRM